VTLGATGVFAAVQSTTPNMVPIAPPSSVVEGQVEDNTDVYVFDEKQSIVLSSSLTPDIGSTIPAGTVVSSHFVHFDAVGRFSPVQTGTGSVIFDGNILGLFTTNAGLSATDATFGATGTTYPTGQERKLETSGWIDIATPSGATLTVTLYTNTGIDQIRVITEGVKEVDIDIKPGSDPNSINLGSKGVIPVAILSSADFDASTIDPMTVKLADAEVKVKGKSDNAGSLEDVNGDGLLDLVVQVYTEGLALTAGDIEAELTAETWGGMPIVGSDSIRIVPPQ
jgi:hypothetical protein